MPEVLRKQGPVAHLANGFRGFVRGLRGTEWFSPLQPLAPVSPASTQPRTFDYAMGYNLNIQPRGIDGGPSFQQLQSLADNYDIMRLAIETRKDQLAKLPWAIHSVRKEGETFEAAQNRSKSNPRLKNLNEYFRYCPDGNPEHAWQPWLRMMVEEVLVTDALSILVRRNRAREVIGLDVIDGATIKPLIDTGGRRPLAPSTGYQQIIKGMPGSDLCTPLKKDDGFPVSDAMGRLMSELVYRPRNPRARKIYGFSPVEQVILILNLAIRRQLSQLSFYTEGNVPEAIAPLPPETTPDQLQRLQDLLDRYTGDLGARRRIHCIPTIKDVIFPKAAALKDEMDEWIARVICYSLSLPPTPFVRMMNRAVAQQVQTAALEEGLLPYAVWFAELVNYILKFVMYEEDAEFSWLTEREADKLKEAQTFDLYVKNNTLLPNEVRGVIGRDPLPADQLAPPEGTTKPKAAANSAHQDGLDDPQREIDPGQEDKNRADRVFKPNGHAVYKN